MHTSTHTFTTEQFADPHLVCTECGRHVEGYVVAPGHPEDMENWPCRHKWMANLCPSWSPVDGCQCLEHLGAVGHPTAEEIRTGVHIPGAMVADVTTRSSSSSSPTGSSIV